MGCQASRELCGDECKDGLGGASKAERVGLPVLAQDAWLDAVVKEVSLSLQNNVFGTLDASKDGRAFHEELHVNQKAAAVLEAETNAACQAVAAMLQARKKALAELRSLFDGTDVHIDGTVPKEELAEALAKDQSIEKLIKEACFNAKYGTIQPMDTIVEGRITWDEFEAYVSMKESL